MRCSASVRTSTHACSRSFCSREQFLIRAAPASVSDNRTERPSTGSGVRRRKPSVTSGFVRLEIAARLDPLSSAACFDSIGPASQTTYISRNDAHDHPFGRWMEDSRS